MDFKNLIKKILLIDFIYLLKDLWYTKNFQKWINHRYLDENTCIIPCKLLSSLETSDGLRFFSDKNCQTIFEVLDDYWIDWIHPGDIVIDIGANIGGFALRAAQRTDKVYAIEPIFTERLKKHIIANSSKVEIIEGALGNKSGEQRIFSYLGSSNIARIFTLTELKKIAGGCDYLKCDCEGGEWEIRPEELEGIRHIEMELHRNGPDHHKKFHDLLNFLQKKYSFTLVPKYSKHFYGILHAELSKDVGD